MFHGILHHLHSPMAAPGMLLGDGEQEQGWEECDHIRSPGRGGRTDEDWALPAGAPELAPVLCGDAECDSPDPSGHH